jgi:hypothetical protein
MNELKTGEKYGIYVSVLRLLSFALSILSSSQLGIKEGQE